MVWAAKIFGEQNLGSNFFVRSDMESKNVWQLIFGRKYLGSKFLGSKFSGMIFFLGGGGQNGEQFLFKANFLERKF